MLSDAYHKKKEREIHTHLSRENTCIVCPSPTFMFAEVVVTCCRDLAFRLKPLEMSDQLINQLKALQSGLEKQARALQDLINQDKNKMKHYTPVMEEAIWQHHSFEISLGSIACL